MGAMAVGHNLFQMMERQFYKRMPHMKTARTRTRIDAAAWCSMNSSRRHTHQLEIGVEEGASFGRTCIFAATGHIVFDYLRLL
jgi:hypothetical protein